VVVEKYGEEQVNLSCEKLINIALSLGGQEYPTYVQQKKKS